MQLIKSKLQLDLLGVNLKMQCRTFLLYPIFEFILFVRALLKEQFSKIQA
jgi:hypothetical protein